MDLIVRLPDPVQSGKTVTMNSKKSLFCFGLGFTGLALARSCLSDGWQVSGTYRSEAEKEAIENRGIQAIPFDHVQQDQLNQSSHFLSSVPPSAKGDPVLQHYGDRLSGVWIGYLSTTGVYGDTGGAPVDETAALNPSNERSVWRVKADTAWRDLQASRNLPVHIFRLAGIYGPGRSVFDRLRSGLPRRIDRPGHLFSRIHVEDIVSVLRASMENPAPGEIYNLCDDEAIEQQYVETFASELMAITPPPLVAFEEARKEMSSMALSFWQDNRRVDNGKIKRDLGVTLKFPDYKTGLKAIWQAENS